MRLNENDEDEPLLAQDNEDVHGSGHPSPRNKAIPIRVLISLMD